MARLHILFSSEKLAQSVIIILLIVIFSAVFFALRATEISDNSLGYAYKAQNGVNLFYAPHLFHAAFLHIAFVSFSGVIPDCDVVCAGQLHTILWALAALLSVYVIVRKLLLSTSAALAVVLFTFGTHGFWVYSTQLEVYVPVVGSLTLLTAVLVTNVRASLGATKIALISFLWVISIFYHQANVIFIAPLACYFFVFQGRYGWRQLSITCVLAGMTVLSAYMLVFWSIQPGGTVEQFNSWVVGLANVPTTDWGTVRNWGLKPLLIAMSSQVNSIAVLQEYLRNSESLPLFQVIIGVSLICVVAAVITGSVIWNTIQAIKRALLFEWRLFFVCWFVTYFLFFAWWSPSVYKFFIPSLVPVIMLCVMAVKDTTAKSLKTVRGRRVGAGCLAGLLILMVGHNSSSIQILRQSRGLEIFEAEVLNALAPENCVVYTKGYYKAALRYFLGRQEDRMKSLRAFHVDFYRVLTEDSQPNYMSKGEDIPDDYSESGEECALIRLGYLTPEYFETKFDSSQWTQFLRWFFDVELLDQPGSIAYDPFRIVSFEQGPPHALIDRSAKVEAADIGVLIQAIEGYSDEAEQTFGPKYWDMRSTSVSPERSRKFIFGYGSPGIPLAKVN